MVDVRTIRLVTVGVLLIASIAYKPLSILLALALALLPEWAEWLLGLVYGQSLSPRMIITGGLRTTVRRYDGMWLEFYRFEPLEDISTAGARVIDIIQELLNRLSLVSIELGFFKLRLGTQTLKVLRVGYRNAGDFNTIKPLLTQYFRLEPLPQGVVNQLLGVYSEVPLAWLGLGVILLLVLGTPLKYNWYYGVAALVGFVIGFLRVRKYLVINRTPVRFRSSIASSDLLYSNYTNTDAYTYAMSVAQLPAWGIVITEDPTLRGNIERAYASFREKAVTRVRGKYEVAAGRYWNTVQRLNTGERTYRIGIWLDTDNNIIPGTRIGMPRNWFTKPWLPALTRDVTVIPIMHGAQVTSGLQRAVVDIGIDRFNNPVALDFDALPSSHGLIVGPTGMGKTKTTMSLMLRLLPSGIKFLVLDPEDEYCSVLANYGFYCVYAGDIYIDFMAPQHEEPVVKASDVFEAFRHAFGVEDHSIYTLYNQSYTGLYQTIDWLVRNSQYSNYWRIVRGLLPRELVNLDDVLANNVVIKFTDRATGRTLRQDDRYVALIMELLITEAFRAFLAVKSPSELVRNVVIADEAYLVLGSRAIWSLVRAGRKRGLALWFATQSIRDAPPSMVQNIGWGLILAGPDAYVEEVRPYFGLSQADYEWLRKSLTPRVLGGHSMGILYVPPTPRHVFVRLEDAVLVT
mgnify:FL=1